MNVMLHWCKDMIISNKRICLLAVSVVWRYQHLLVYQSPTILFCSCLWARYFLSSACGCVIFQCLIYKKLQDTQHRQMLTNELLKFHMQVSFKT